MRRISMILIPLLLAIASCVQSTGSANPGDSSVTPGGGAKSTRESDWAAIVALEDQAKAIAKTSGCSSSAQCRSAPVGNRACGGPRYYIAYCAATTDSASLFAKLKQVSDAESTYNRKYNLTSTCEFRIPPEVGLAGGACVAK